MPNLVGIRDHEPPFHVDARPLAQRRTPRDLSRAFLSLLPRRRHTVASRPPEIRIFQIVAQASSPLGSVTEPSTTTSRRDSSSSLLATAYFWSGFFAVLILAGGPSSLPFFGREPLRRACRSRRRRLFLVVFFLRELFSPAPSRGRLLLLAGASSRGRRGLLSARPSSRGSSPPWLSQSSRESLPKRDAPHTGPFLIDGHAQQSRRKSAYHASSSALASSSPGGR